MYVQIDSGVSALDIVLNVSAFFYGTIKRTNASQKGFV